MARKSLFLAAAVVALVACSSQQTSAPLLPQGAVTNPPATSVTSSSSTTTLPPQGVYNSCEIDTALTTMCEQEDAAMRSDGFTWEINYIGLMANKTGTQSLKAWFT